MLCECPDRLPRKQALFCGLLKYFIFRCLLGWFSFDIIFTPRCLNKSNKSFKIGVYVASREGEGEGSHGV